MRKIILVLFVAIMSSCSSDDEGNTSQKLSGEWFLIRADCFCAFDETIDLQDFKLSFDQSKNTLHLDNPTESYFYIAESGSYNYNVEGNIISVEGIDDTFKFEIRESKLILTRIDDPQIADDELVLTYQKM